MPQNSSITDAGPPVVGPLVERDLPEAERIFRVAFGTFLGVPEPETFWSDRDYVYGRWRPMLRRSVQRPVVGWSARTSRQDGEVSASSARSR